jgi:hypothetical protein
MKKPLSVLLKAFLRVDIAPVIVATTYSEVVTSGR